jgi:hypothetical protein
MLTGSILVAASRTVIEVNLITRKSKVLTYPNIELPKYYPETNSNTSE